MAVRHTPLVYGTLRPFMNQGESFLLRRLGVTLAKLWIVQSIYR